MVPTLKSSKKFHCEVCDYYTSRKSQYERHLSTDKHKILQNPTHGTFQNVKLFNCGCGKKYKHLSTLYAHRKICYHINNTCNSKNISELTDNEIIKTLLKIVENGTNNNNNNNSYNTTNTTNNAFNLNFFLNETCKDAMNINDFVSSIKVSLSDLENTGRHGYIEGITNIILKNLSKVEDNLRPIHCSDTKREVFYIKDNNEWQKENQEKPILTKAIKVIANENIKQIKHWCDKYPDCTDSDSKKNNLYLKIVSNSMNGSTQEEGNKNIDKIISNVAKEVTIDKSVVL
jgi:hypothetical protein